MKKTVLFILLAMNSIFIIAQTKSLYDFEATDIDGNKFDMSTLKGKKVMIVNVASKCGLTPQYTELEELYKEYKDKKLVIIAFPANNFKEQEPGTNEEIKEFCSLNYGVTFPIMSKIDVVGEDIAPIYKWLTQKSENGKFDAPVTWNFQKFMINEDGQLDSFAAPQVKPKSPEILEWINK